MILFASNNKGNDVVKRFGMNLLIYIVANVMYPNIFETVGYMYEVTLDASLWKMAWGCMLLLLLTIVTNFRNIIYQHGFDVLILGIFLPIATMIVQINSDIKFMFYPFGSIILIALTTRVCEGTRLIKALNYRADFGLSFVSLRKWVLFLYSSILMALIIYNNSSFSLNFLDVYIRTYEIRSAVRVDGFFGYFIGWFALIFFPIFLCANENRFKLIYPLLAFVGAIYIFQAFALKIVLFNFFLVAAFAFVYGNKTILSKYFPQVFFLTLFFLTYLLDVLLHPLLDRFFYIIGLNSIYYFDFFSQNSLRYFEGSKLDFGIASYGMDVGFLIDKYYYQNLGGNSSAGYLPTIFSDLGIIGVLFASMAIGLLMSVIKSIQSSSESFTYLVIISFAFSLLNSSFNMLFLTNGLMFIVLLSFLLKNNRKHLAKI